eukprot:PhF_6_TR21662/c1_g3_i9/m.30897
MSNHCPICHSPFLRSGTSPVDPTLKCSVCLGLLLEEGEAFRVCRGEVAHATCERCISRYYDVLGTLANEGETAGMCPKCQYGPLDVHTHCGNLQTHHLDRVRDCHGRWLSRDSDTYSGWVVNSCPQCSFFSQTPENWVPWDQVVRIVSADVRSTLIHVTFESRGSEPRQYLSTCRVGHYLDVYTLIDEPFMHTPHYQHPELRHHHQRPYVFHLQQHPELHHEGPFVFHHERPSSPSYQHPQLHHHHLHQHHHQRSYQHPQLHHEGPSSPYYQHPQLHHHRHQHPPPAYYQHPELHYYQHRPSPYYQYPEHHHENRWPTYHPKIITNYEDLRNQLRLSQSYSFAVVTSNPTTHQDGVQSEYLLLRYNPGNVIIALPFRGKHWIWCGSVRSTRINCFCAISVDGASGEKTFLLLSEAPAFLRRGFDHYEFKPVNDVLIFGYWKVMMPFVDNSEVWDQRMGFGAMNLTMRLNGFHHMERGRRMDGEWEGSQEYTAYDQYTAYDRYTAYEDSVDEERGEEEETMEEKERLEQERMEEEEETREEKERME